MKFVVIFSIYLWSLLVPLNLTLELTSINIEQRWNSLPQMASYKNYEQVEKVMKRNAVKSPFFDDYLSTFAFGRENPTANHRIDKRTADPLDYIKFELADAKEPNEDVKQILQMYRMQQQKEIEELEKSKKLETIIGTLKNDSKTEITSRADDQDFDESQLIKFYQPVVPIPISIKSKKTIDNFPIPVRKAINLVLGENKNVARSLPPAPQKYYNDKNLIASALHNYKILAKQKDLGGNVGNPKTKYIYVPQAFYESNQYVAPTPNHVGASQPFINAISSHDRGDRGARLNDISSFIQPNHLVQIAPPANYVVQEAQNLKILPQAAEEAFKNYNYLLEPNQYQHNLFSKVNHGQQISDEGKDYSNINSDNKNSEGDALGNYLQAAESGKQNSPEPKNIGDDAISKYNALASLIGKPSGIQLNGLTNLLENEFKSVGENKRPQDNRAPILFHPEGQQNPLPKNIFINRYGYKETIPEGDRVDEFSAGSYKPIVEPAEEEQQVINIKPQYKYVTVNEGHDLFGLKTAYKGLAEDHDMQYASKYAFGYRVRDFHTGNDFGHKQNRDHDGTTHGQYHILLPDGRVQNVRYHADDSGFHADVSFESGH